MSENDASDIPNNSEFNYDSSTFSPQIESAEIFAETAAEVASSVEQQMTPSKRTTRTKAQAKTSKAAKVTKTPKVTKAKEKSTGTAAKTVRPDSETAPSKNSTPQSDDQLIASIQRYASEANKFSAQAGAPSIRALNRFRDIGAMVLDEKAKGKFRKPLASIKDWCNENLSGVVGDQNPYAMVSLCMSLAKRWELLTEEFKRREDSGNPIGPLPLQSALTLARQLSKGGDDDDSEKPVKPPTLRTQARDTFKALADVYKTAIKAKVDDEALISSLNAIVTAARKSILDQGFAGTVETELDALPFSYGVSEEIEPTTDGTKSRRKTAKPTD